MKGALAVFDCEIIDTKDLATHRVLFGKVTGLRVGDRLNPLDLFRPLLSRLCEATPRSSGERMTNPQPVPQTIDETLALLAGRRLRRRSRAGDRAVPQPQRMRRPLFLEGEAGVGKTEIAKVLASALGRRLIRLQCYEGLDVSSAVYEWNYAAQMIEIRMEEAGRPASTARTWRRNVFSEKYLIRRPVLEALDRKGRRSTRVPDRRARPHR